MPAVLTLSMSDSGLVGGREQINKGSPEIVVHQFTDPAFPFLAGFIGLNDICGRKMPSNQKKIRDIERMIKKFGSSPELLAKLEEAKHGKEDVQLKERMRKNSTKYHMVRFLERKKVTRLVRSLDNKLKNDPDNTKLKKNRDKLLNDLAYIM